MILLSSPEPDLIRHQPSAPEVVPPADTQPVTHGPGYWEVRMGRGSTSMIRT
jgi:hypothetical protein